MAKQFDWDFASVTLHEADKAKVEAYAEAMNYDIEAVFDMYAEDFIKISGVYSEQQSAFCLTLTPQEGNAYNSKISMVSWAETFTEALWISAYKHAVICNRKKYPTATQKWG